jgi:hypothetical protein
MSYCTISEGVCIFAVRKQKAVFNLAKVAQLVEHNLAKVGVAGSNPVFRSLRLLEFQRPFLLKRIVYLHSPFLKYYGY